MARSLFYDVEIRNLKGTGAVNFADTMAVTGAATIASTLGVTGATTLSSTVDIAGAVTMSSTCNIAGATTMQGALTVSGTATFIGAINASGTSIFTTLISDDISIPGTTSSNGTPGQIVIPNTGTSFAYFCIDTNSWARVALSATTAFN